MIGSLLRFSSAKDEVEEKEDENLMPEASSNAVASEPDHATGQTKPVIEEKLFTLDELGQLTRKVLMDKNLEVSKVKPFFWSIVESYIDRFHVFPFDATRALFSYLEMHELPADELRSLVKRIEALYEKQQGSPMHKSTRFVSKDELQDDEVKELRETLKYAAMVGERLDGNI